MIFCGIKHRGGEGITKDEEDDAAAAEEEKQKSRGEKKTVNFLQGSKALPVSVQRL